jgi:hypothetical protein
MLLQHLYADASCVERNHQLAWLASYLKNSRAQKITASGAFRDPL